MPEAACELAKIELDHPLGLAHIAETFERLRAGRSELGKFIESSLAAMEEFGSGLTWRQDQIALREAQLQERVDQLQQRHGDDAELKQLMQQQTRYLEALAAELQSVRGEIAIARDNPKADPSGAQLQAVVARLEEQRDDLKQRLDVCRDELARRGDATEQLAATQTQLSEARQTIVSLREKIEQLNNLAGSGEADHERIALETELEMVRRRAAELSEALAEQKDQLAHHQALWSTELRSLRQIIDAQCGAWAGQVVDTAAAGDQRGRSLPAQGEGQAKSAEPVVDSIMEQFAKLQKDVAQRRKRKLP